MHEPPAIPTSPSDGQPSTRAWLPWAVLGLLCVVAVPITLRRPLTGDSSIWNLLARVVERGGVPYEDVFETNPPGAIWLHLLVRSTLGTTSEALRLFDLLLVGTSIAILARLVVRAGRPPSVGAWAAVALLACYSSQSIWCQCQRDFWMLTFACLGVAIRTRRPSASSGRTGLWRFAEGLAWGLAASLKPFVLVPWLAVEVVDRRGSVRHWLAWCAGFGVVVAANVVGLVALGAWASAWEIWLDWNPTYFAARSRYWGENGFRILFVQFGAWFAVHLLALPLAMATLFRANDQADRTRVRRMLAALYLGWMLQAFLLQHWHGYVHVPALLLAIGCIAAEPRLSRARAWWPCLAAFGIAVVWHAPPVRSEQLTEWPRCFEPTISPETRDRLRGPLDAVYPAAATFEDVEPVARFLKELQVEDGEVLAYGFSTAIFYDELELLPAARFAVPRFHAIYFPDRRREVLEAIERSRPRYVVTDLVVEGGHETTAANCEIGNANGFPWGNRVVFRSGRYLIHRIDGDIGTFTTPDVVSRPDPPPSTSALEKASPR